MVNPRWRCFVPTTPVPTSGFLLIIPEESAIPIDVTVDEAMKAHRIRRDFSRRMRCYTHGPKNALPDNSLTEDLSQSAASNHLSS